MQALITGAKNAKERQRKPGAWQTLAAFEVPREALPLPELHRAARQDIPGPPPGMAGLHISAPASLQRGGRTLQPDSASTPLGGGPGGATPHLFRLFRESGLPAAARVEHAGQRRGRVVPAGDEVPGERGRRLLQPQASRCRGEQRFSACAAAGGVGVSDGIHVGL